MRALVVGYGSIARRHIASLRTLGVREFIVFRPAGTPGGAPADLKFVSSVAEGIRAQPGLAVIASPSSAHVESLLPLLGAAIPCYVEKPAVTAAEDIVKLRELLRASAHPPVTLSGCNFRFLPSLRHMREALRSGRIGRPVRAHMQAGQWLPDWRPSVDYRGTYSASSSAGGGVIFDLIHELDVARWFFGEFDDVLAFSAKLSRLEIESEDTACILLGKRDKGPLVAIGLDYVSRRRVRRYEVVGDEGTLVWDLGCTRLALVTANGEETLLDDAASFDVAATYVAAMGEFVSAVKGHTATSQDLLDGLMSVELAIRARSQP